MASIVLRPLETLRSWALRDGRVECVSILFPEKSLLTNRYAALGPEGTHHDLASHSKCTPMFIHMLDVPCIHWRHLVDLPGRQCSKPNRFAAASFKSARSPLSHRPYRGQRFQNRQDGLRIQWARRSPGDSSDPRRRYSPDLHKCDVDGLA